MSDNQISLNGKQYTFEASETILTVARRNGIFIPTLCHLAGTIPTGACRVCVVEVERARNLVPSCSAPAGAGMVVLTDSPRVLESRRKTLSLVMASGNHNCDLNGSDVAAHKKCNPAACPVEGDCKLQDYARQYKISLNKGNKSQCPYPTEDVNPFIIRDFSRCIHCGRCVQACNEVQVNNAISQGYRGGESKIVAGGDRALKDSDCVFCGECVQSCPTGALVEKDSRYAVRPWETKKIRTTCSYCGVGCQLYLHVKNEQVVKVTGVESAPPNYGSLCVKGRFGYDFINSPERLTHPLIKENGEFRKASWDEALNLVASKLTSIKKDNGSQSLAVLASARITNEENYIAQKFARAVLNTNNIDHCARLCHASTVAGLAAAFGSGAMTNGINDSKNSDVILITGSNPTENHPVMGTYIKRAVKSGKTKLIVVDPRKIGIGRFADVRMSQKPGTDVAWINTMMHVIIKEDLYDKKFVEERTEDFEVFKAEVAKYTPEYGEQISGIPKEDLIAAARLYAGAKAGSIVYAMGITQHSTGTDNVKSLANLAMLCGNIGIPGGGVNPLRGQNNVQGACDMGSLPVVYTGYQKVADPAARDKFSKAWGVQVPDAQGLTVVEIMNAAETGKVKGVYIIGENPMVSDPDLNHTEECIKKLEFLVVQDIFLTETAMLADVVLPSVCFAEKDGTFTNTERKVLPVNTAIKGPGEARQDWDITCDIARRMGYEMSYDNASAIFEEIVKLTPSYGGMTHDRLKKEDGLCWPCPTADHPGTPILHIGKFTHGLGKFHAVPFIPPAEGADDKYPLTLTTGRLLYHYHTGTMTMKSPGLNERVPECFIEISNEDAKQYNISQNQPVKVASRRGSITAEAHISDKMMPGTVFIPFHFANAAANRLTNAALDPVCKIPELKVCAVTIEAGSKSKGKKRWGQLDIQLNSRDIEDAFVEFLTVEGLAGKKSQVDDVLKSHRNIPGAIIPVLQKVQKIIGYLPTVVQSYIALGMNLPDSDVYGIVSFYAFFSQVPSGKYTIKVCMGTACYVMGAGEITSRFEDVLNVKTGEVTKDKMFGLETVRCLGACGLAPVIMVNDDTHGAMNADKVKGIIERYKNM